MRIKSIFSPGNIGKVLIIAVGVSLAPFVAIGINTVIQKFKSVTPGG